ncbi:MAG: FAD-dependent oxidoreductase [Legionella sp.]|nr:FAD-dependent oxidoreductase [Legionella sp.]
MEIANAVRQVVGADFPLIFRIPCLDLIEGGLNYTDTNILINKLIPYGIDLLNVSIGWHESKVPTIAQLVPSAGFSPVAACLRKQFPDLLIAVSNRINDPRVAEQLLIDKTADLIALGRPFLSDPQFVVKAYNNQFKEINTCIACNQSCLDFVFNSKPVGCSVNPDCGTKQEGKFPLFQRPIRIAVIGGGIAGLSAAVFLAKRGATVVLFEQSEQLGGQLQFAAKIPGKQEFQETIRYYTATLGALGVDIRLNTHFNENTLKSEHWVHLVIATGSVPNQLQDIPGIDGSNVYSYADILLHELPVPFPAVIIGGGGVACDVANYIIEKAATCRVNSQNYLKAYAQSFDSPQYFNESQWYGTPVTILQRSSKKIAYKVGLTTRWITMEKLEKAKVAMFRHLDIIAIRDDCVEILNKTTGKSQSIAAKSVIIAAGQQPEQSLLAYLQPHESAEVSYSLIGAAEGGNHTNITTATASAYEMTMALDY